MAVAEGALVARLAIPRLRFTEAEAEAEAEVLADRPSTEVLVAEAEAEVLADRPSTEVLVAAMGNRARRPAVEVDVAPQEPAAR